ncbi:DUF3768 domain-containing protein [Sinorhizobium sp. NFACC03]|uniref:DUF3768 domain-containing protein n=1 Tax=Sinorhizobium sp. NFACC03 TaxID=1566295 RepID=UPI0008899E76|nr:DUF3768 domain-containing protein [Sinorhizobium sp. NFACC03]SDA68971.1 Protein of unknown function [Sinorhizobium sp. NFACC03]
MTVIILPIPHTSGVGNQSGSNVATPSSTRECRIRDLNDELRRTFSSGRVMLTSGVQALEEGQRAELLYAVQQFDEFTSANDPYGEHDFGRVVVDGQGYFFKVDYYDADLQYRSPDPADVTVTTRVLTIMREDEY